jgi:hypothetical protein
LGYGNIGGVVSAMMTTIRASQPDQQACAIAWRTIAIEEKTALSTMLMMSEVISGK